MVYHGFCDKQKKNYSVKLTPINASAAEDLSQKFIAGRLECTYAGTTGCCTNPDQCSILKNINK